jgi:hypothetical protein
MSNRHDTRSGQEGLAFPKAVMEHLGVWLRRRGFVCLESSAHVVRFRSDKVVLELWHEPLSFELEVQFGRAAKPEEQFSLGDLLDAVLGAGHKEEKFFQASDAARVDACVKKIAELLREHAGAVLEGEGAVYERIGQTAQSTSAAYTKQVMNGPVRKAAEEAWRAHDYHKVRDLYDSISSDLTALEQRRLRYAKTHAGH